MHLFTQHLWTYPREIIKDVCCNDSIADIFTKIMFSEKLEVMKILHNRDWLVYFGISTQWKTT